MVFIAIAIRRMFQRACFIKVKKSDKTLILGADALFLLGSKSPLINDF